MFTPDISVPTCRLIPSRCMMWLNFNSVEINLGSDRARRSSFRKSHAAWLHVLSCHFELIGRTQRIYWPAGKQCLACMMWPLCWKRMSDGGYFGRSPTRVIQPRTPDTGSYKSVYGALVVLNHFTTLSLKPTLARSTHLPTLLNLIKWRQAALSRRCSML